MYLTTPITTSFSVVLYLCFHLGHGNAQTWGSCLNGQEGVCIDTNSYSCSKTTLTGKCPGAANIRCCPAPAGVKSTKCTAEGGLCKISTSCSDGKTKSGLCPGPSSIKCCVPKTTTTTKKTWIKCTGNKRGICINTNRHQCSSSTLRNRCPGGSNIRCCPDPGGVISNKCSAAGGVCKKSSHCSLGKTKSGLCPGPSSIKCCVPKKQPAPAPTKAPPTSTNNKFLPESPDISGSTGPCTTPQDGLRGNCINRSKCTGGTFNGLCSGGSNNLCCVAETRRTDAVTNAAPISLSQFRQLFTGISATRAGALYPYFVNSLNFANINTCRRLAAYVGQIGHESVGLLYFEELASGDAYEGRTDLGNTQPGDGRRYKGRGPIQLTGRSNYRSAGQGLGRNFEGKPERVGMPSGGFEAAAWYWKNRVSNADADAGTQAGYNRITVAINGCGGNINNCNGVSDRNNRWNQAKNVLGC